MRQFLRQHGTIAVEDNVEIKAEASTEVAWVEEIATEEAATIVEAVVEFGAARSANEEGTVPAAYSRRKTNMLSSPPKKARRMASCLLGLSRGQDLY